VASSAACAHALLVLASERDREGADEADADAEAEEIGVCGGPEGGAS
jgi:hypothetical protein